MPQVNLSTLNGRELRQLLDASRRRGDATLSYQILQEMAARRERPAERGPFMTLRPAEPRLIPVELADPMEQDDLPPMPKWRPPPRPPADGATAQAQAEAPPPAPRRSRRKAPPEPVTPPRAAAPPEPVPAPDPEPDPEPDPPPPPLDAERPLTLSDFHPDPPLEEEATYMTTPGLSMEPVELGAPRTPRPRFRLLAGLALGAVVGLALGWLGGWLARDAMTRPTAPIRTALLTPAPIPPPPAPAPAPVAAAPAAEAAPEAPVAPIPQDADAAPATSPKTQEPAPAPVPDGAALELPAPGAEAEAAATAAAKAERTRAARDRTAPAVAAGCAAQPTPADRQICGDPELRRLQGELRRAYNEALQAHEDRATLRERQLAWRDARNDVTDPDRLAKLYEARIRKLNAATAEARRGR